MFSGYNTNIIWQFYRKISGVGQVENPQDLDGLFYYYKLFLCWQKLLPTAPAEKSTHSGCQHMLRFVIMLTYDKNNYRSNLF